MRKYYSMVESDGILDLYVYGDITSYTWMDSDVSAYGIVQELDGSTASQINVYVNSYGGEVAEGLAIYNALKRHHANVTTYCDGFACSAASVVFMAGDERVMGDASLLMIHNAWSWTAGNAKELRKSADDLEKISESAAEAYRQVMTISNDELTALLDGESWIEPIKAMEYGFATSVASMRESAAASMSTRRAVFEKMRAQAKKEPEAEPPEPLELPKQKNKLREILTKGSQFFCTEKGE